MTLPLLAVVLLLAAVQRSVQETLYDTLGITRDASDAEVKAAYRRLARTLHPDTAGGAEQEQKAAQRGRYIRVQLAYEVLKDQAKRRRYDTTGEVPGDERQRQRQGNAYWRAAHLFDDGDDVTALTGEAVDRAATDAEPWVVFFWSRQFPACVEAAGEFQRIAERFATVVHFGHVDCDHNVPSCHRFLGVTRHPPEAATLRHGRAEWLGKAANEYNLVELVYQLVTEAAPRGLLPALKPTQLPPAPARGCEHFVVFETSPCADCEAELAAAVLRLELPGRLNTLVRDTLRPAMGRVRCATHPHLCERYGIATSGKGSHTAWRAASICAVNPQTANADAKLGEVDWFTGRFEHAEIASFLLQHLPSFVTAIRTRDEFRVTVEASAGAWVVALVPPRCRRDPRCAAALPEVELTARVLHGHRGKTHQPLAVALVRCGADAGLTELCAALRPAQAAESRVQFVVYAYGQPRTAPFAYDGPLHARAIAEAARAEAEPSPVHTLGAHNWQEQVAGAKRNWLVLFTAGQWCPPCVQVKDIYRAAARLIEQDERVRDIAVGVVDCDAHRHLCNQQQVGGYPTIVAYINKKEPKMRHTFEDFRSATNIREFAVISTVNEVVTLTDDLIRIATASTDYWFVLFTAGQWCPPCVQAKAIWGIVAARLKGEFAVGRVDCDANRQLCNNFGIRGYPTFILYARKKDGSRDIVAYDGDRSADALVAFALKKKQHPGK